MRKLMTMFFGSDVEFRVKLLNSALVLGAVLSALSGSLNIVFGYGLIAAGMSFFVTVSCAALLWYVTKSGNHKLGNIIVITILFALAPVYFYDSADLGYTGEAPLYFGFVLLLTAIMLKGRLMIIFCAAQLITYVALILHGYRFPSADILTDEFIATAKYSIAGSVVICFGLLAAILAIFFRLYDRQTRELETSRDAEALSRRKVEELSKMQSDLFARMSHEMRTPLTTMSTYAQLAVDALRSGEVPPETVNDLATVSGEAYRLAEMADSTLKILSSSYTPDGLRDNMAADLVNVGELAGKVVNIARSAAVNGRPRIGLDTTGLHGMLIGDANMLMQLFWNLLSNAIAHSAASNIWVRVSGAESDAPITIIVEDDGKGVSPGLLPRIFDKGVSGANSSGLGLHLCKEIARCHGGDIVCETGGGGKGTRFTVTLARDAAEE